LHIEEAFQNPSPVSDDAPQCISPFLEEPNRFATGANADTFNAHLRELAWKWHRD